MPRYSENAFALFLGCTIPLRFPFIESASRKAIKAFDFETKDLPFGCCPDPLGVQSFDKETWAALAAHNLCLAEEEDLDILTLCNGCFETLSVANAELQHNDKIRIRVNKILGEVGKEFKGKINVRHIIQEFHDLRTLIPDLIARPLANCKFAVHYGCHFLRPAEILQTDHSEHPVILDELVQVLQGNSIPYLKKGLCCGAGVYGTDFPTSTKIIQEKLAEVGKTRADAIIVICPTCFRQYESGQILIKRNHGETYGDNGREIPVIHYAELLAFALGFNMSEEFNQHRIKLSFNEKLLEGGMGTI
ncbi:MAG: CoB--CoM heterodisulfide reductase subunit B [Candidatus Bathyarchaeota archaeon]|nr:MAG: CoB--CoM heterodisulfide reductase subunit B [Candidatus Bathyarchaeota archaeon]